MGFSSLHLTPPGGRLMWALLASLALHAGAFSTAAWQAARKHAVEPQTLPLPALNAHLPARPPPLLNNLTSAAQPAMTEPSPTPLLSAPQPAAAVPVSRHAVPPAPTFSPAAPETTPKPKPLRGKALAQANAVLSETLFYPPEAVARGLEGQVMVLLHVAAGGSIERAEVAVSSGHPLLDSAALTAVLAAAGRIAALPGGAQSRRQVLLPVDFHLE